MKIEKHGAGAICSLVQMVTNEFFTVAAVGVGVRRERRRVACHMRQIAMYICHVALRMTMTDVGRGFGRDRSTVAHACHVVEDRRDNREYDAFITSLERVTLFAFGLWEGASNE